MPTCSICGEFYGPAHKCETATLVAMMDSLRGQLEESYAQSGKWHSRSEVLQSQLDSALAREAGLRGALEKLAATDACAANWGATCIERKSTTLCSSCMVREALSQPAPNRIEEELRALRADDKRLKELLLEAIDSLLEMASRYLPTGSDKPTTEKLQRAYNEKFGKVKS